MKNLKENEAIFKDDEVVAFYSLNTQENVDFGNYEITTFNDEFTTN